MYLSSVASQVLICNCPMSAVNRQAVNIHGLVEGWIHHGGAANVSMTVDSFVIAGCEPTRCLAKV